MSQSIAARGFGIHHDAGDTTVTVSEGMHFADQYHHIDRALERVVQRLEEFKAAFEHAVDQLGCDKDGGPLALLGL